MNHKFLLALALTSATLPAAVIYQQDFEASSSFPAEFSGAGAIETTGGLSAFGLGNNHLRNAGTSATQLVISGIGPHTLIRLTYDLVLWDSVDAFSDIFQTSYDTLNRQSFMANYGSQIAAFSGPGVLFTEPFTAFAVPNYGQNPGFRDQARRVLDTFLHSSSTLTINWSFPNSQGGSDESFGLDNILIETIDEESSAVPEPATFAITGAAMAALAFRKRRKN